MRTTNLAYKREFPFEQARARAARWFAESGARYLVLGHFHQELRFEAGEGEVLTSDLTRQLMIGSKASFAERGEFELKGVPGSWPLFAATFD